MPRTPLLIVVAIALLAGCSKNATEPSESLRALPPALVATEPAPRSTGVLYDSGIWGQFDRALDPATVNTKSVFLKLDGQRISVNVSYEAATQRVVVSPKVSLELQRTYTVDFTPAVLGADGTPLPEGVFFQFTTNTLRRISYDYPASGELEGPLVTLGWGGTQLPVNHLFYEVYASTDSLQVAQRSSPMLQRSVFTRFLPSTRWPEGAKVYWAITSENLNSHERLSGPVQSFQVLPASVPVESMDMFLRDFGSNDIRNRNTQYCARNIVPSGPGFNAALHWDFTRLPADARVTLASMSLHLPDTEVGRFPSYSPVTAWMSQNDWQACSIVAPGPPYTELSGQLATAVLGSSTRLDFAADRLAAFVEAQARLRTLLPGLLIRSRDNFNVHSPIVADGNLQPRITVHYQRLSAAAVSP